MKAVVATLGLAVAAAIGAVVFLWPTQQTGAEPINYGRDACAHCRMHLSQPGYAGEFRDRNGVLTKYDDIGCLLHAMLAAHEEIPEAWVEDHDGGELIPLLTASLVRADAIDTPMGYGIVTFRDEGAARRFAQSRAGEVVSLEQILKDPARLVPARRRVGAPSEVK